jgi:bifunctional non-homologous end joining protein LigD
MLATLTDQVFSRQGWLFEPKWDGKRCLAFRRGRDLDLFSRNRIRLNAKYPEVVEAIHHQETSSFIADGEIVTFDGAITSFAKLQRRMQVEHPSADLIRKVPVWFYLFDLLYVDRYDIRQIPLRYRKQVLRNAFDFEGSLRFAEHRKTEGEDYYRRACQKGWEGIIEKKRGQPVCVKANARLAQIQVQARAGIRHRRLHRSTRESRRVRSIAAGLLPRGEARVCRQGRDGVQPGPAAASGREVGTAGDAGFPVWRGWATATRRALGETETRRSNRIHRVDGGRQHPRFLGLRDDKRPEDVVREG